jgi:hypothetical protein
MTRPALTLALTLAACAPALATRETVHMDPGGGLFVRVAEINQRRQNRQPVAVLGVCASACTLYLALAPHGLLCTSRAAVWGFHGPHGGDAAARAAGVAMMALHYPPSIAGPFLRSWQYLGENELATLSGADMIRHHGVPEC